MKKLKELIQDGKKLAEKATSPEMQEKVEEGAARVLGTATNSLYIAAFGATAMIGGAVKGLVDGAKAVAAGMKETNKESKPNSHHHIQGE
ncbi:MAG: hypothetical protein D6694_05850 [Gammaproteobacteria bacterium]|nr:MAG: hypothetical protein D6694_05850 [Gammaproteobacteria bacterium]